MPLIYHKIIRLNDSMSKAELEMKILPFSFLGNFKYNIGTEHVPLSNLFPLTIHQFKYHVSLIQLTEKLDCMQYNQDFKPTTYEDHLLCTLFQLSPIVRIKCPYDKCWLSHDATLEQRINELVYYYKIDFLEYRFHNILMNTTTLLTPNVLLNTIIPTQMYSLFNLEETPEMSQQIMDTNIISPEFKLFDKFTTFQNLLDNYNVDIFEIVFETNAYDEPFIPMTREDYLLCILYQISPMSTKSPTNRNHWLPTNASFSENAQEFMREIALDDTKRLITSLTKNTVEYEIYP